MRLDRAPDPNDQLAISKIAFQVAVEANRVTPATFPAVVSTALLGAFPRALTEPEIIREVSTMTQWATSRGFDYRLISTLTLPRIWPICWPT